MNNKVLTLILIGVISFIVGFFLRGLLLPYVWSDLMPINDLLPAQYGCNQIARWHQDYLMREYGIEFNTDIDNPKRDMNQKAGELNGKLAEICFTDPTK